MASYRTGLEKLFKGILNYRHKFKDQIVDKCSKLPPNHEQTAVFFSCIDARLLPNTFMSSNPGDMFVVRNAANMIPHAATLKVDPDRYVRYCSGQSSCAEHVYLLKKETINSYVFNFRYSIHILLFQNHILISVFINFQK